MKTPVHTYIWTLTIRTRIPPVVSFLVTSQVGTPHHDAGSGPLEEILPSQPPPNFSQLILSYFLLSIGTRSSFSLAHLKAKSRFQVGPCGSPIIFFPCKPTGNTCCLSVSTPTPLEVWTKRHPLQEDLEMAER